MNSKQGKRARQIIGLVCTLIGLILLFFGLTRENWYYSSGVMFVIYGAALVLGGLLAMAFAKVRTSEEKAFDRIEDLERQVKELKNRP